MFINKNLYLSRLMTKPTKWHVRPAKTQISLDIRPVCSESSLGAQWVANIQSFLHADGEDWSDWADAETDLSLRWAHMPFCWFCREAVYLSKVADWKFYQVGLNFPYEPKNPLLITCTLSSTKTCLTKPCVNFINMLHPCWWTSSSFLTCCRCFVLYLWRGNVLFWKWSGLGRTEWLASKKQQGTF